MRVQICGQLAIEVDGERLETRLPGRQGCLLFVYLVVNRLRPAPRDELVEALWPDGRDAGRSPLLSKLRRLYTPAVCRLSPQAARLLPWVPMWGTSG